MKIKRKLLAFIILGLTILTLAPGSWLNISSTVVQVAQAQETNNLAATDNPAANKATTTAPISPLEEEILEGKITHAEIKKIFPNETVKEPQPQILQTLTIDIYKGSLKGQKIEIQLDSNLDLQAKIEYQVGDKIIVNRGQTPDGQNFFYITDFVRRDALLILTILFIVAVVLVGRLWGLASLFSMAITFMVIFKIVLPLLVHGADPVLVALLTAVLLIPVTFYLSHGWNKKTHVAVLGTFIALIITALLAVTFVNNAHLTGFASEEAGFLAVEQSNKINIRGLLLAGIIIGSLGILDDITVSMASVVFQLKKANPKLQLAELFKKAMKIGQDHISSMVNTLVLVYAGASMPLLLLFVNSDRTFTQLINFELIAEEIVRTLVGSIGLIFAAPMTAFFACLVVSEVFGEKKKK